MVAGPHGRVTCLATVSVVMIAPADAAKSAGG
jgi:hypothetical protein